MEELDAERFRPHLGAVFDLAGVEAPGPVLELVEVRAGRHRPGAPDSPIGMPPGVRADPFSVLFRGPPEPLLAQGMYRLENPRAGSLDLFLVPVGRDGQGVYYEAVFS